MSWEEKRKFKRAVVKVQVECRGKRFWQNVEAKDVSAGGMFLATEMVEEINTPLEIMFEFGAAKERKNIYAEGIVVWNRTQSVKDSAGNTQYPTGMGIMFTKITPKAAKDYIDQMIKSLQE